MPLVNEIHVVVDIGPRPSWAGTNSALNLTVSGGGQDLFSGSWTGANQLGGGNPTAPEDRTGAALVPMDTENRRQLAKNSGTFVRSDLWAEINYGIFTDENPYQTGFDAAVLDPSSLRLATRGSDLVRPRHIVVWGMADAPPANYPAIGRTVRTPIPLGMAINQAAVALSTDFSEGMASFLVPRVAPWRWANPAMPDRRVDTVILTLGLGDSNNAGTPSPVTFSIQSADGQLRCSQVLEGIDQLRVREWKTWVIAVTTPFTWSEIVPIPPPPQPCRLKVDGDNMLQVAHVFAFGVDSTTTPAALLPLVHFSATDQWVGRDELLLPTANHDVSETA